MTNNSSEILLEKILDFDIQPDENWAIYGTGKGATTIIDTLEQMGVLGAIKVVIDNDNVVKDHMSYHGIPVKKLADVCNNMDGIIIGAIKNHEVIKQRIERYFMEHQITGIKIVNIFAYNTKKDIVEYVEYIENFLKKQKTKDFVEFDDNRVALCDNDPRIVTWYLPQYHQIEINNQFHGRGFTEWTNTTRAIPVFTGHYQPHIPYDVGYYDLNDIETLKRQIFLAKHYGITAFCFHYYWFSGTRIMEKPLQLFLEHKELDIEFCINWANENWTALWDGGEQEMMYEQGLQINDDNRFMQDILPFMQDSRYMKIDGKPIMVIYRANIWKRERVLQLLKNFRIAAQKGGFPDLYIILSNARGFDEDVTEWGADAIVEFPPHVIGGMMDDVTPQGYINPYFNGWIKDAESFINKKQYMMNHKSTTYYRAALTSWDNTARKATSGATIYTGLTPGTFKTWLTDIICESKKIHSEDKNIVFVNSWNEWAEGSHLEPDMKYGYAYLQALKEAIEESR